MTFDINSNDNSLFVTSQCNNKCLMCAQPPLNRDDIDFFYAKNIEIIDNAPNGLTNIGLKVMLRLYCQQNYLCLCRNYLNLIFHKIQS